MNTNTIMINYSYICMYTRYNYINMSFYFYNLTNMIFYSYTYKSFYFYSLTNMIIYKKFYYSQGLLSILFIKHRLSSNIDKVVSLTFWRTIL